MKSSFRAQLPNAFRVLTAIPILLFMLFPSSVGIAQGTAPLPDPGLSADLSFTSAPIVGRPAELVLSVVATKGVDLEAQIILPKGVELVSGSLTAAAKADSAEWKHAVIVKTVTTGEYKLSAVVTPVGQVGVATDLYLSSAKKSASVGKVPVKTGDLIVTPDEQPATDLSDTSAPQQSPDLEIASSPDGIDGPQPASSQEVTEAGELVQSKERFQLREGLGLASKENPMQFELASPEPGGYPVEMQSGISVIQSDDSQAPVVIDRTTLDKKVLIPAIGLDSTFQHVEKNLLAGPDLVVWDLWSTTNPLMINEYNTIVFQVKNQGDTAVTTPFRVVVWIGGSTIDSWYMDALAVGQYASSYFSIYIGTAGLWSVSAYVDYEGKVVESNESNNNRYEYWVWMSAGKDLVVEDLYTTTNPIIGGEWETLVLALRNVGNTNITETFYLRMTVGGVPVGYWYAAGMRSQGAAYGVTRVSMRPGNYIVYGVMDTTGAVAEANEANNTRTEYWSWAYSGSSNLIVSDIYSSTWPPSINVAENITFVIKNTGTTPAYINQGESVSALSMLGTQPGGSVKVAWDSELNTPATISGDLNVSGPADQPEVAAANYFATFAGLYGIRDASQELAKINIKTDELGMQHVRYQQKYQGLDVFDRQMIVHVNKDGRVASGNGSFVPNINLSIEAKVAPDAALEAARQAADAAGASQIEPAKLLVYVTGAEAHLAYLVRMTVDDQPYRAFVDAHTSQVLDHYSEVVYARNRQTYTAGGGSGLPGTLILTEASASSADTCAWGAHSNIAAVYNYWANTFGRDSYNGAGAVLKSTVHYGYRYNNAFWNGSQMVYGDGDGSYFKCLALGMDVVAHEMTHAVVQSVGGLNYVRESGALNESMADFFAAMIDRADWMIGEDVYTPNVPGDALRYMNNPPVGGQPDNMTGFRTDATCTGSNDWCYVHYNSGIPNKAAYLASDGGTFRGVYVAGIGRDKLERIWWRGLDLYFVPTTTFLQARSWLITSAADIYGSNSREQHTVEDAFAAVGLGSQSVFYTYMYIDGAYTAGWYTNELLPGYSAYGRVTRTLTTSGPHTIRVYVDVNGRIQETNEGDNWRNEVWVWK